jgi:hypothetical protein
MKRSEWMRRTVVVMAGLALAAGIPCFSVNAAETGMMGKMKEMAQDVGMIPVAQFNAQGELIRPADYREWVFVGAPVTPNALNNGKAAFPEFHNVYIDPASYHQYQKTGTFREGTMLVKELVSVGATKAVSGNGYFEGEFLGLAASVKDSKRFAKEPGGWAFFSFTGEEGKPLKETAKALPTSSCNDCHKANAQEDWVFTQYYPVLRAARGK